jgi:HAD superfamily hydrolase (TIGR01509 family)
VRPSLPASSARVDALLFDLGGVVIEIDFGRVFQAWADAASVSHARIAQRFSPDAGYEAHERGEISAQEYCKHLRATLGVTLGDEILLSGWNQIFVGPIPGVEALLESLARAYRVYAFSNTNVAHRAFWQARYATLLQPFSQIFCSCDLGVRKPSADAFLEVSRRIGIAPGRIVFFDDHPQNVRGARAAGLLAHEVHSAGDIRAALQHEGIQCDC